MSIRAISDQKIRMLLPPAYSRIFHLDDDVAWSLQLGTRAFLQFSLVGAVEDDSLHCAHIGWLVVFD